MITQLQQAVGEHFAVAQGGGAFTSPEVALVMRWFAEQGAVAIGQTSWGPTGFCAVEGLSVAEDWVRQAKQHFAGLEHLSFVVVSARNSGGDVFFD